MKLEKLKEFSRAYHDQPVSYDDIFQELVDFYAKHHEKKIVLTKKLFL